MENYGLMSVIELIAACTEQFNKLIIGGEANVSNAAAAINKFPRSVSANFKGALHYLIVVVGNVDIDSVRHFYAHSRLAFYIELNAAANFTRFVCGADSEICEKRAIASYMYHVKCSQPIRTFANVLENPFSFWDWDAQSPVRLAIRTGHFAAEKRFKKSIERVADLILSNVERRNILKNYTAHREANDDGEDVLISHNASIELADMFAKPIPGGTYSAIEMRHFRMLFENVTLNEDLEELYAGDQELLNALTIVSKRNFTRIDFRDLKLS